MSPVQAASEDWTYQGCKGTKLTSDHYILYTTCRSKYFVNALPTFLETCWQAYERLLPTDTAQQKKCEAYLFQTRWQWERFTDEFTGSRSSTYKHIRSGGYSERGVTVSHYGSARSTLPILAHEGLHQYLELTHGQNIPPWINEGLACYFEAFDLDDGNRPIFKPESNTLRTPALREALAQDSLIPLAEILSTHAGLEVHKQTAHVSNYYAQEWSLVLFLMRPAKENPYHDGFQELLQVLGTEAMERKARAFMAADTEGKMSHGEAVFRAFVCDDLEKFQADYEAFLAKLLDMST